MPVTNRFLARIQQRQQKPKKQSSNPPKTVVFDKTTTKNSPSTLPKSSKRAKSLNVRFDDDITIVHHAGEGMTQEEERAYYLQPDDLQRISTDLELTSFRWYKAQQGRYHLDDTQTSIRGLEKLLDLETTDIQGHHLKHASNILLEVKRQKQLMRTANNNGMDNNNNNNKGGLDWEKIRAVAEPTSALSAQRAAQLAQEDAVAASTTKSKSSSKSQQKQRQKQQPSSRKNPSRRFLGQMKQMSVW